MKEYYVKIKPCCDNCVHKCGAWYCKKDNNKNPLPDHRSCSEFEFDDNILRPSVISIDYFVKNKE